MAASKEGSMVELTVVYWAEHLAVQLVVSSADWTAVSLAGWMAAMMDLGMAALKVVSSVAQLV